MRTIPNYGAKLLQNLHIRKCSALKMHVRVQKNVDFALKNSKNTKKMLLFCIFFEKYLVMSKKSSTFALAFEKEDIRSRCYRLVA